MDLKTLSQYCLTKKGTAATYPFGDDTLVMKVLSKMFALLYEAEGQMQISLKCDPFIAEQLRQQYAAVVPGYHLNKQHWNTVHLDGSIGEAELLKMIDHSYELVAKGLTKAQKQSLLE